MLRVVGDGPHVVVARREVDAVEAIGMRDRTFLPELVPDRIRVVHPARIGMVEVAAPVRDRRSFGHGLLLRASDPSGRSSPRARDRWPPPGAPSPVVPAEAIRLRSPWRTRSRRPRTAPAPGQHNGCGPGTGPDRCEL